MANYLSLRSSNLISFAASSISSVSSITTTNTFYSTLSGSSISSVNGVIGSMTYSTLTGSRVAATTLRTTNSIISLGQSTNASNFGQSQGSYANTTWYSTLNATFTPTGITKVSMVANAQHQLAINGQSTVSSILLTANAGQTWTSLSQATGLPSATNPSMILLLLKILLQSLSLVISNQSSLLIQFLLDQLP